MSKALMNAPNTGHSPLTTSLCAALGASLIRNRMGTIGLVIVAAVVLTALSAPLVAPADPVKQSITEALKPPAWLGGGGAARLGTDYLGRDIFSRIVFGSRVSLAIGTAAVAIGGGVGSVLGLVAGYQGGWIDTLIMRIADFQLSVPSIVLAIAVIGVLGAGLRNLILVLGITSWMTYARVVRSEMLSIREREFVTAATAVGASRLRIVQRHVLPNVSASIIVIASLEVARMIVSEAALSFIGLGVPPPAPSWGGMIADGRNYLGVAWWISTFPGVAIVLTVLGINLLGDWLRDTLDPQLRRSGQHGVQDRRGEGQTAPGEALRRE